MKYKMTIELESCHGCPFFKKLEYHGTYSYCCSEYDKWSKEYYNEKTQEKAIKEIFKWFKACKRVVVEE